jgi:hypothetical protein
MLRPGERRLISDIARKDAAGFIESVKSVMDADALVYRDFYFLKDYTYICRSDFDWDAWNRKHNKK